MSISLSALKARKYRTVSEITGPLLIVKSVNDAAYNELVKVDIEIKDIAELIDDLMTA